MGARFKEKLLHAGTEGEYKERLAQRKTESGLADREDIQCFVDYIDADEGRVK